MKESYTLIVDDEADIRELLEMTLQRMQIKTLCAATIGEAKALLKTQQINLCLTDMKLPDGDGLELLDYIQQADYAFPVVVITAYGNMDIAIRAMKKGAFDFVSKPVDLGLLRQLVQNALKLTSTINPPERRSRSVLLGDSPLMCEVRSKIAKVALSQAPVYISGESGSGKELVARLIHQNSPRADQPFIAVNCGAIPFELMESEFFGHKKGSFTGATVDKQGLFQAAEGGTLFLDEVADLPAALQVKLLRAIQEKKVRPIGEQQEIAVNIRLLSATHKNLADMVQAGEFRQDLFYRINVIELSIPPLRNRDGDIPQLAEHILISLSKANGIKKPALSAAALSALQHYYFPGNVRELENILERALALFEGNIIDKDDLGLTTGFNNQEETTGASESLHTEGEDFDEEPQLTGAAKAGKPQSSNNSLENYLESIERQALQKALEETRWNKTAAAKQLGLSFRSLRYRLKKLGME
ncbi:MAG: sigma-54 dependent transcriptional regulator [Methylococcales bacterium]